MCGCRLAVIPCLVVVLSLVAHAQGAGDPVRPTLDEIFGKNNLLGVRPERALISGDGQFASYWWHEPGGDADEKDLQIVPATGGDAIVAMHSSKGKGGSERWSPANARLVFLNDGWLELWEPARKSEPAKLVEVGADVSGLAWMKDGERLVFLTGAEPALWTLQVTRCVRHRLLDDLAIRAGSLQLLEDGVHLAVFAQPREKPAVASTDKPEAKDRASAASKATLHIVDTRDGTFVKYSDVSEGTRAEIAPDGSYVLLADVQSHAEQRDVFVADFLTELVTKVPARSSLAGDPAADVDVKVVAASGETFVVPVAGVHRYHYWNAEWAPNARRLLLERVSQDYHVREILAVDVPARTATRVFVEEDRAWIGGPVTRAAFALDGDSILFTSERDGFNHLYRVSVEGGEPEQLTRGRFEVTWFRLPSTGATVYYTANEVDPAERHLYALNLATGNSERLPTPLGMNGRMQICESLARVVFLHGELGVPDELYALKLEPGATAVRLTHTVPSELTDLHLPPPEVVSFASGDVTVRALLYRPTPAPVAGAGPPAVVFVHGAGYLQNVTRSMTEYPQNMLFHQRLARLGYFVIDVDYRHSAGYGRDWRTAIYKYMGGKDLDDLVAAVPYLKTLGVDENRVGLYGGSYGGFLTLMALFTKPQVFACGAALRSVTDWRSYHAQYTNPRLGNPKEDPEAYKRSSPIDWAEGLQKPLLLLHGLKDSNVFAQDTIRLMERLIKLGKDFDVMLYPSQNHGFDDPASWIDEYRRIERLFDRHLKAGVRASAEKPREEAVVPGR